MKIRDRIVELRRVPARDLLPDPRNWRTHPKAQREALQGLLSEIGYAGALLARETPAGLMLIDGHLRAETTPDTEVPVLVLDVDEKEAAKLLASLDPLSAMAGADDERLAEILRNVETDSEAVKTMLAKLAKGAGIDLSGPESDVDAEPQVGRADELRRTWGTELGQLWLLGDHRLLCGDSTSAADVVRLMNGQRAVLFATDPPYLVDYTGTNHPGTKVSKNRESLNKDWSGTYRDFDRAEQGHGLYDGFIAVAVEQAIRPDAAWYCWHASRRQAMVEAAWERHGAFVHQQIIWAKERAVLTRSWYLWQHEPCFFGWVKGQKPPRVPSASPLASVWTLESVSRAEDVDHPCLHPESLVLTDGGYREIQSVRIGDKVYAADGTFHPVADVSAHPYTSPALFRIVAKGSNIPTLASDNHPFLIWRPKRAGGRIAGGDASWIRADELRVGDYTMTPVPDLERDDPFPERDEEYWFLFGLYLAQGSLQAAGHGGDGRYPVFALHKKRQDLVNRISDRWESTREYDPNDYGVPPTQGLTLMAFDARAGREFEELGGRGARTKRIAPVVFELPRSKRMAVLEGWLNGDGCRVHDRDYWQGKTVSPDLAAQLALLGDSVGFRTNVFRYDPPAETGSIGGRKFLRQSTEYHLYFYARTSLGRRIQGFYVEHDGRSYSLRYIKSIEKVPYEGDVWNLTVEGCASFQTAVGMSHNTPKPVECFAIPMRQHTEPGDLCYEPFCGSGSQVIAAERTGRRCYAMELAPEFVAVTLQRFQDATGKKPVLADREAA